MGSMPLVPNPQFKMIYCHSKIAIYFMFINETRCLKIVSNKQLLEKYIIGIATLLLLLLLLSSPSSLLSLLYTLTVCLVPYNLMALLYGTFHNDRL